jgi:hypothetical protein
MSQSLANIVVHLVFSTKRRRPSAWALFQMRQCDET